MKQILLNQYRRKTPRAQKPYQCGECRGYIARGERYARYLAAVRDPGNIINHEVFRCQHCDVLARRINEVTTDNPVTPGDLAPRVTANPEWKRAFDENAVRRTKGNTLAAPAT